MGTICASSYENIFLAEFEQKYVYRLIKDRLIFFLRYIDDQIWKTAERFYEWTESTA